MPVTLFPPYTTSLPRPAGDALAEAPEFVRTRGMSRWHRPRSGVAYPDGGRHYDTWCGYGIGSSSRAGTALACDMHPDDGLPVCGTCDGRAAGAGLLPPCPWHAWRQFTATEGRPHCACGQPLTR